MAAGAMVTRRTDALARGRVTGRPVHAVALQQAEGSVETGGAAWSHGPEGFTQQGFIRGEGRGWIKYTSAIDTVLSRGRSQETSP